MAVKAASGASREELQEIVDLALMAFPVPTKTRSRATRKAVVTRIDKHRPSRISATTRKG
jgi:hypothetical protein